MSFNHKLHMKPQNRWRGISRRISSILFFASFFLSLISCLRTIIIMYDCLKNADSTWYYHFINLNNIIWRYFTKNETKKLCNITFFCRFFFSLFLSLVLLFFFFWINVVDRSYVIRRNKQPFFFCFCKKKRYFSGRVLKMFQVRSF